MRALWTHLHAVIALCAIVGQFTSSPAWARAAAVIALVALVLHAYALRRYGHPAIT